VACPIYYAVVNHTGEEKDNFDPSPDFPIHWALDRTIQSFASNSCASCSKDKNEAFNRESKSPSSKENEDTNREEGKMSRCGGCGVAFYCAKSCQVKDWKTHKKVCGLIKAGKQLYAQSSSLHFPSCAQSPSDGKGSGASECLHEKEANHFRFQFGENDMKRSCEDYDSDELAIWEYDAGTSEKPNWKRYPPLVEEAIEDLADLGAPKYMYRPNDPSCEGRYIKETITRSRLVTPTPGVATNYIVFDSMVEQDVFTGAFRRVRRNGKHTLNRGQ